jgi:hypothetical protein
MLLALQPQNIPHIASAAVMIFFALLHTLSCAAFFILNAIIGAEGDSHVKISICDEWPDATAMTKPAKWNQDAEAVSARSGDALHFLVREDTSQSASVRIFFLSSPDMHLVKGSFHRFGEAPSNLSLGKMA